MGGEPPSLSSADTEQGDVDADVCAMVKHAPDKLMPLAKHIQGGLKRSGKPSKPEVIAAAILCLTHKESARKACMKVGGFNLNKNASMRVSKMVKERNHQLRSLLARAVAELDDDALNIPCNIPLEGFEGFGDFEGGDEPVNELVDGGA